ncbi:MAG: hypothetical protein AAF624_05115 [Bacteroidota bacterium]
MTLLYRSALVAFALLLLVPIVPQAQAQDVTTFTVVVERKTSAHPYSGQGHPDGYVIDGVEANEVTLVRGQTYVFQLQNVSAIHPFYLSTSATGAGAQFYDDGVQNNGVSGNEAVTFTVPMSAPDELWYQCVIHAFMGWRMNIVNPTTTDDDALPGAVTLAPAFPNPFADATALSLQLDRAAAIQAEAFDRLGRRVAVLYDGTLTTGTHTLRFDGAALPNGAYVIRVVADGEAVEERLVTLSR